MVCSLFRVKEIELYLKFSRIIKIYQKPNCMFLDPLVFSLSFIPNYFSLQRAKEREGGSLNICIILRNLDSLTWDLENIGRF